MRAARKGYVKRTRRGAAWTVRELRLLGKLPDSVLAHRNRRAIKEVVAERERRFIRLPTGPRRWTARELRLLGRYNDAELSRWLRRKYDNVRRQRRALRIPTFKLRPKQRWWT